MAFQPLEPTDKNNIRITGSAKKRIASDLIEWSATIESKGSDRTAAYVSLKGGTDKAVEFLKAQGIKPNDTSSYEKDHHHRPRRVHGKVTGGHT